MIVRWKVLWGPRLRGPVLAAAVLVSCMLPARSDAQGGSSCLINVTGVSFGNYNVFNASSLQSTGSVVVRCGNSISNVEVTLSRGQSSTFNPRQMTSGGQSLSYNLYRDAARSVIWGDGTGGTETYRNTSFPRRQDVTIYIYGDVPAAQDVSAGTYSDSITATIIF